MGQKPPNDASAADKKDQNYHRMTFFRPNSTSYREFGVLNRFLGSDCKPEVVLWLFLRMRREKTTKTAQNDPQKTYFRPKSTSYK